LTAYIDSSAAAKLIAKEAESAALIAYLDQIVDEAVRLAASCLLETELRRLALRLDKPQSKVTEVLDRVALIEADRLLFLEAGLLPGKHLRSLDALHTATALRIEADEFLTYDARQAEAARSVGLRVTSPA
jgi:predicted nucleic acid-binding protein